MIATLSIVPVVVLVGIVLIQRATINRMRARMQQRTRNDLFDLADVLLVESAGRGDGLTPDEAAAWDDITRRL